jgi:hypothetical protein
MIDGMFIKRGTLKVGTVEASVNHIGHTVSCKPYPRPFNGPSDLCSRTPVSRSLTHTRKLSNKRIALIGRHLGSPYCVGTWPAMTLSLKRRRLTSLACSLSRRSKLQCSASMRRALFKHSTDLTRSCRYPLVEPNSMALNIFVMAALTVCSAEHSHRRRHRKDRSGPGVHEKSAVNLRDF